MRIKLLGQDLKRPYFVVYHLPLHRPSPSEDEPTSACRGRSWIAWLRNAEARSLDMLVFERSYEESVGWRVYEHEWTDLQGRRNPSASCLTPPSPLSVPEDHQHRPHPPSNFMDRLPSHRETSRRQRDPWMPSTSLVDARRVRSSYEESDGRRVGGNDRRAPALFHLTRPPTHSLLSLQVHRSASFASQETPAQPSIDLPPEKAKAPTSPSRSPGIDRLRTARPAGRSAIPRRRWWMLARSEIVRGVWRGECSRERVTFPRPREAYLLVFGAPQPFLRPRKTTNTPPTSLFFRLRTPPAYLLPSLRVHGSAAFRIARSAGGSAISRHSRRPSWMLGCFGGVWRAVCSREPENK
ncbi:hypothetical protein CVT26_003763 [Gymnopilus dilepis]|uniref:Uncharacterized protein n=1 Tax=Gymnopilus dilepis TaxID=231916 RepID=A0A409X923_9AGAR|nr:hypothetical protein CVT26_003763 [Gymnopilus dilepis]